MRDLLKKLFIIVTALVKLIPTLLDIIEDFADDGKRNKSNSKSSS